MSILMNGTPTKPFWIERGLRQEDPLSPFLFVFTVEMLNKLVAKAVELGKIENIQVGREGIELSHLQFVDDTLLFCLAEKETSRNYWRLLLSFEIMLGLTINFEKSTLIPLNCDEAKRSNLKTTLDSEVMKLPIKYLCQTITSSHQNNLFHSYWTLLCFYKIYFMFMFSTLTSTKPT